LADLNRLAMASGLVGLTGGSFVVLQSLADGDFLRVFFGHVRTAVADGNSAARFSEQVGRHGLMT
jgi:hypothetical protein